jgi:hypothetical protein
VVVSREAVQPMDAVPCLSDTVVVQDRLARLAGVEVFEESVPVHDESRVGAAGNHTIAL